MNDNSPRTSTSLIARAQASDPDSWERLCRLYGPMIYDWARGAGLQREDAADVMQDVFNSIAMSLQKFQKRNETDSFRGWLWTVTKNKVRDHFRRRKIQEMAIGGSTAQLRIQELPDSPPSCDSIDGKSEIDALWNRALNLVQSDFEPQTWQAFYRMVIQGDEPKQIAADLGISSWTVYKAKSRVLQRLREEFDGLLENSQPDS